MANLGSDMDFGFYKNLFVQTGVSKTNLEKHELHRPLKLHVAVRWQQIIAVQLILIYQLDTCVLFYQYKI